MSKKTKKTKRSAPQKKGGRFDCEDMYARCAPLIDLMDNIPDGIYFKNTRGKFILVNKAYARGIGWEPEQIVGRTDFDIFPKKHAQRMVQDDKCVLNSGKSVVDKIERALRRDGTDHYVSTTKIPRYDGKGKIVGLIGVTRDVTKRVQFEQLKEKKLHRQKKLEMLEDLNRSKAEFLSAVSHELRTPLSILKQLLMLIYEETLGPVNDKQREVLVKMRHNTERLREMIDKLLDISRLESKNFKLRYSLVNIAELLKDSQEYFKELAAEKDIVLSSHLPKEEVDIFIDPERIRQVVSNLLNNAVKFTEHNGRIRLEVAVLDDKIRVGVFDTGIGIRGEDIPRLFHKFTQVSGKSEAEKKGVGLGLAIARELVERHGGEIWAESQPGAGSKFYFTLPRFYTAHLVTQEVKDSINSFLHRNIPVHLINLLLVNYEQFKRRVPVAVEKISEDLKAIINASFKEFFAEEDGKHRIIITDIHQGKYSIVFPEATEVKVSEFCRLLSERIKTYFVKYQIENVFIALGILSYPSRAVSSAEEETLCNLSIKEIYIGAEMRRYKRIRYETTLEVTSPLEKKQVCRTLDISHGGICFLSRYDFRADEKVGVRFSLLKKKKTLDVHGRIAWIKRMDRLPGDSADQYKVGLEFSGLSEQDRGFLSKELKLYYE